MKNLSPAEKTKLIAISQRLSVNPKLLWAVIQFESRWDPSSKNPRSSAKGLLQFINSTARELGYTSSLNLITRNKTRLKQLDVVYRYLKKYAPFTGVQSLLMSIFYPRFRKKHPQTVFPEHVRSANPGIVTIQDYLDYVGRRVPLDYIKKENVFFMVTLLGGVLYFATRKRKRR